MTNKTDNDNPDTREDVAPQKNAIVRAGFHGAELAHENSATAALVAKQTADIQARWVMAMRNPRSLYDVRQALLKECERPAFAKVAMYAIPRGGKTITGASIRFAEVAMRCMRNMSCEAQTLYDSFEERVVRVTATDFESNTSWFRDVTIKKTIERKQLSRGQRAIRERHNSFGDLVYIVEATDEDVAFKEGSAISKSARTAILRLVPGHIQAEALSVCEHTLGQAAAKDPDHERNQVFDHFATELNVMPAQIADYLGHGVEQITPAEIVELRKLYGALSTGELDWGEAMAGAAEARARAKANMKPAAAAATAAAPKTDQPANGNGSKPAAAATPAPSAQAQPAAKPASNGGRGAAAVKDKVKTASAERAEPKPADMPPAAATPDVADGFEIRPCNMCGVELEVEKTAPQGQQCEACRNS